MPVKAALKTLNEKSLRRCARILATQDDDLAFILATCGQPPLWARAPGFPTLVHIILEQQVSLASAKAAFDKLHAVIHPLTPQRFLKLDAAELKTIGFSRQKTLYSRLLAEAMIDGALDLTTFEAMPDDAVRSTLTQLKGIGHWTTDIYLLMVLLRPDVWPKGDLALAVAMQRLKKLKARPTPDELELMAENWKPYRAIAARMLWHFYLSEKAARAINRTAPSDQV